MCLCCVFSSLTSKSKNVFLITDTMCFSKIINFTVLFFLFLIETLLFEILCLSTMAANDVYLRYMGTLPNQITCLKFYFRNYCHHHMFSFFLLCWMIFIFFFVWVFFESGRETVWRFSFILMTIVF